MTKSKHHKPKGPKSPPQDPAQEAPEAQEPAEPRVPDPQPPAPAAAPTPAASPAAASAAPEVSADGSTVPPPVKPKRNRGNRNKKKGDAQNADDDDEAVEKIDEVPKAEEKSENVAQGKKNKKGGEKKTEEKKDDVEKAPAAEAPKENKGKKSGQDKKGDNKKKEPEVKDAEVKEQAFDEGEDDDQSQFIEAKSGRNKKKNKKNKERKESESADAKQDAPAAGSADVSKKEEVACPVKPTDAGKAPEKKEPKAAESPKGQAPAAVSEQEPPVPEARNKKNKKGKGKGDNEKEQPKTPEVKPTTPVLEKKAEKPKESPKAKNDKNNVSKVQQSISDAMEDIFPSLASSIEETLQKLIVCESDVILNQQLEAEEKLKEAQKKGEKPMIPIMPPIAPKPEIISCTLGAVHKELIKTETIVEEVVKDDNNLFVKGNKNGKNKGGKRDKTPTPPTPKKEESLASLIFEKPVAPEKCELKKTEVPPQEAKEGGNLCAKESQKGGKRDKTPTPQTPPTPKKDGSLTSLLFEKPIEAVKCELKKTETEVKEEIKDAQIFCVKEAQKKGGKRDKTPTSQTPPSPKKSDNLVSMFFEKPVEAIQCQFKKAEVEVKEQVKDAPNLFVKEAQNKEGKRDKTPTPQTPPTPKKDDSLASLLFEKPLETVKSEFMKVESEIKEEIKMIKEELCSREAQKKNKKNGKRDKTPKKDESPVSQILEKSEEIAKPIVEIKEEPKPKEEPNLSVKDGPKKGGKRDKTPTPTTPTKDEPILACQLMAKPAEPEKIVVAPPVVEVKKDEPAKDNNNLGVKNGNKKGGKRDKTPTPPTPPKEEKQSEVKEEIKAVKEDPMLTLKDAPKKGGKRDKTPTPPSPKKDDALAALLFQPVEGEKCELKKPEVQTNTKTPEPAPVLPPLDMDKTIFGDKQNKGNGNNKNKKEKSDSKPDVAPVVVDPFPELVKAPAQVCTLPMSEVKFDSAPKEHLSLPKNKSRKSKTPEKCIKKTPNAPPPAQKDAGKCPLAQGKMGIPDDIIQALLSDMPPEFIDADDKKCPITKSETVKEDLQKCALKMAAEVAKIPAEDIKKAVDNAACCLLEKNIAKAASEIEKVTELPSDKDVCCMKTAACELKKGAEKIVEKIGFFAEPIPLPQEDDKHQDNKSNQKHDKKNKKNNNKNNKPETPEPKVEEQLKAAPAKEEPKCEMKKPDSPKPQEKPKEEVVEHKPTEAAAIAESKPTDSPKPAKRNNKKNKQGGCKGPDSPTGGPPPPGGNSDGNSQGPPPPAPQGGGADNRKISESKDTEPKQGNSNNQGKGKGKNSKQQSDFNETGPSSKTDDSFELLKISDEEKAFLKEPSDGKDDIKARQKSPMKHQSKNLLGQADIPAKSNKYDYKKEKNKDPEIYTAESAKMTIEDVTDLPEDKQLGQGPTSPNRSGQTTMVQTTDDQLDDFDEDEEEFVYKYSFRTVFIANACHICKLQLTDDRVVCRFCHLVGYCGEKHRDDDWSQHQSLCYSICTLSHVKGVDQIYGDAPALSGHDYRLLRMQAIVSCEKLLKRKLCPWEQEVLLYPRMCAEPACREWRTHRLQDCTHCGQVSYCRDHPEHLGTEHTTWCQSYRLYHRLVTHQLTKGRIEPPLPAKILPRGYSLPDKCSTLMDDLYGAVTNLDECHYATLTQLSTAPLTALYAYQKTIGRSDVGDNATGKMNGIHKKHKETFCLHIVGAELQFEADTLGKWEVFFLHLMPELQELRVVFVGPELNTSKLPVDLLGRIRMCAYCRQHSRIVRFEFHDEMLYHDFAASDKFSKPDLICAFNPGFHRATGYAGLDTWPATISAALSAGAPLLATAYTEHEAPRDLSRILSVHPTAKVLLPPTRNPLRSLRPDRNFISDDEMPLIFKNYQMLVVAGS